MFNIDNDLLGFIFFELLDEENKYARESEEEYLATFHKDEDSEDEDE